MNYYLAVDIGASSGRHILGYIKDGWMCYEEVYRFENGPTKKDGHLCWDLEGLFGSIVEGLKECKRIGKVPVTMGIDTWAVDFVLLDRNNELLGPTVSYRDERTKDMDKLVYERISQEELYARTGIQKQIFNTIYQLMAVKEQTPEYLEQAESMLMIPDYFHFRLTGEKKFEYTNASTTQLVSPQTKDWDRDLIRLLGYPEQIFPPLSMPGTVVGCFSEEIQQEVGFNCTVILPGTHDTASAVLAVPMGDTDSVYISSGTWSLMGVERREADCSEKSCRLNFTNEGGYEYRFRYLKNIMGLWMIQSVRHELKDAYSFAELCELAEAAKIESLVDCNDPCFLAPESMVEEVKCFCQKSGQPIPETPGELARVIYRSLACCYGDTVKEIEEMTEKVYPTIHIVGGGANAEYLNRLTAESTGKAIHTGPTEATAIGNLTAQMLQDNVFSSVAEARNCIHDSFQIKVIEP
ncbi:MAG: rhamnulokinase [Lachnospiraceae bacterium]|jgi:rhamnulokinase|nr:rhamnulokinase [Lachnospiraceae bacterium]